MKQFLLYFSCLLILVIKSIISTKLFAESLAYSRVKPKEECQFKKNGGNSCPLRGKKSPYKLVKKCNINGIY